MSLLLELVTLDNSDIFLHGESVSKQTIQREINNVSIATYPQNPLFWVFFIPQWCISPVLVAQFKCDTRIDVPNHVFNMTPCDIINCLIYVSN